MGETLFVLTVIAICVGWWLCVQAAPVSIAALLPKPEMVFMAGFGIFAVGIGAAAISVYAFASPTDFIGALLTAFWGGWLMLIPDSGRRSSPEAADMMERLALMLVALMCVLVLSFYARETMEIAGLQLWLVLLGAVIAIKGVPRRHQRR